MLHHMFDTIFRIQNPLSFITDPNLQDNCRKRRQVENFISSCEIFRNAINGILLLTIGLVYYLLQRSLILHRLYLYYKGPLFSIG